MSFRSFGGYSSSSEVALTLEALARPLYRLSPTFERFLWWPRERHVLLGSLWSTQLLIVPMPAYLQATTVECLTAYSSRVLEHVSRPNPVTLFFSILKPISNSDLLNRDVAAIFSYDSTTFFGRRWYILFALFRSIWLCRTPWQCPVAAALSHTPTCTPHAPSSAITPQQSRDFSSLQWSTHGTYSSGGCG